MTQALRAWSSRPCCARISSRRRVSSSPCFTRNCRSLVILRGSLDGSRRMSTLRATARKEASTLRTFGARTGGPGCHRVQTTTHDSPSEMSLASPVTMLRDARLVRGRARALESAVLMSGAELSAILPENFRCKSELMIRGFESRRQKGRLASHFTAPTHTCLGPDEVV
jgi:hypothetical protein